MKYVTCSSVIAAIRDAYIRKIYVRSVNLAINLVMIRCLSDLVVALSTCLDMPLTKEKWLLAYMWWLSHWLKQLMENI